MMHLINTEREKNDLCMCRDGISNIFETLKLFVEARNTTTWFCIRVKFNTVYNWMRVVLNELFSCLLLLRESKQQFCPILLTVVSAVWLLLKWERIAHHPYHFKNLSWLLEMFIISLAKESNLSTLENYWSVNKCLLNPRYVFRIPAQLTEWAITHNGSFFPPLREKGYWRIISMPMEGRVIKCFN